MPPVSDLPAAPPLRLPAFSREGLPAMGRTFFIAPGGDDDAPGTKAAPWATLQAALERLGPGDTVFLRGGVYFERVYCAACGTPEAPITIQGYPGEAVFIDGGFPEFQNDPAGAWVPGEAEGEYVSTRSYRNIRDVLGLFADTHFGLQTYWHHENLLAENELAMANVEDRNPGPSVPYYCGPGVYYHKETGRIHCRLAPTRLENRFVHNYEGEDDPRRVPLVIAPFRSSPLHLDQAMHLRFRNLVLRGGGYNTLLLHFAVDVQFEYVTVYGGTYCIRSKNSGPLRLTHCGVFGQIPPWAFRDENSLQTFDPVYYDPFTQPPEPRDRKNIARLPTHALLVTEGGEESDVFLYPFNNRWEISYCEFADSHDGLYFNGHQFHLHHCWIHDLQDDVVYLSSPTPSRICEDVHIRQNYLSHCMLPFGTHRRGDCSGRIFIYGNVIDMRHPVRFYRPTFERPEGRMQYPNQIGCLFLSHGHRDLLGMENIAFYHNTAILPSRFAGHWMRSTFPGSVRSIFNNLFVYCQGYPEVPTEPAQGRVEMNGNLHWAPGDLPAAGWLEAFSSSGASQENAEKWGGAPWETEAIVADPCFLSFELASEGEADLRLAPESPARSRAVALPEGLPAPTNATGPHLGALQNSEPLRVGIEARVCTGAPPPWRAHGNVLKNG